MKQILIGLTGKAGCGKDTAAKMLIDIAGGGKIISFAAPMKAGLAAMGFPEPEDREAKELKVPGFDFTWRHAAQTLGTEWGRKLDTGLWVKAGLRQVAPEGLTVISDVRFPDEASAIWAREGVIIELEGRKADLGTRSGHESENGISKGFINYSINNRHDLNFLRRSLELIYSELAK